MHDAMAIRALADGMELLDIRWPEDAHSGCANGGGDMQRARVVADEKRGHLDQRPGFLEGCAPRDNCSVVWNERGNFFAQGNIVLAADEKHMRAVLLDKRVRDFGKALRRPALASIEAVAAHVHGDEQIRGR